MFARVLALVIATSTSAAAGGMVLPVQGVHSLERAGALVAGADDPDALWLDPAGLARLTGDGRRAFLFDIAYVYQPVQYTPAGALAAIANDQPGAVGIPTVAASLGVGDRLVIAAGITGQYGGLARYDATGAQRYALVSTTGTSFAIISVGAGYVVGPGLRVGATVQDRVTALDLQVVASACPPQQTCAPGDAAYDLPLAQNETAYLSPSGSLGVQYDLGVLATVGATLQAPSRVSQGGTLTARMPTSPEFTGAAQVGTAATASFWLPPTARAGIELHPTREVRVEAALDVELWSLQDAIDITPSKISIAGGPAGAFALSPMTIARDYHTSFAPSLGGEVRLGTAQLAAGVAYETAAAPAADVSVLTVDAPKWLVGLGGGYDEAGWQIGAAVGYAHLADVDVSTSQAAVHELQPLRAQPTPVAVNAGVYRSYYVVAGLRLARKF
ncbi:MAG TPA: outer membrane protein transport protein [Kofleriaceae bacterium]|nr:outer membrane protein transport protein [Kofleriaceae bacterium]